MKKWFRRLSHNRILLLARALFRLADGRRRLFAFFEQAVTAVVLLLALRPFIAADPLPYAVFLFSGLAPWYYFKEVLFALFDQPARVRSLFGPDGYAPSWFPAGQALAALPTLLLWTGVCILAAFLFRMPPARIWLVAYFIICNVFNAAAQGMFAAAFMPLFPGNAQEGLSVTVPFMFWTSPVAWPVARTLSGLPLFLMRLNPLFYLADCLRGILQYGALPPLEHTAIFFVSVAFVGVLGQLCLNRVWKSSAALW
ncbi:MAG TPA: hypothetical protein VN366_13520 [Feifaniaceae bacterium]|nr:hypothetical protein [Feifaniaceae bacterium]